MVILAVNCGDDMGRRLVPIVTALDFGATLLIKKFDQSYYSKTSFLVQIKFITEDLQQTQTLIKVYTTEDRCYQAWLGY
jgi:hypothetical protein